MSYREEMEQQNSQILDQAGPGARSIAGAPGGARHNVLADTDEGATARPGGASQNSGGAFSANGTEQGDDE